MLYNYDVSLKERLTAFTKCVDKSDVLNTLVFTYVCTSSRDVGEYLMGIASLEYEDVFIRFTAASILTEHTNKYIDMSKEGFGLIDQLCDCKCPPSFRQQLILYMMRSSRHVFRTRGRLLHELNSKNIPENKKYTFILRIQDETEVPLPRRVYFELCVLPYFMERGGMDGILAAQRVITLCRNNHKYSRLFEDACLYIIDVCYTCEDVDKRADAADVLLNMEEDELKEIGRVVIEELAGSNIYHTSKQNVHIRSIEESCASNLARLLSMQLNVEDYTRSVEAFINNKEVSGKLGSALERIEKDRLRHTKYNVTLSFVFCRVWSYISTSNYTEVLTTRLVEELEDGAGLCSSGFLARMLNSLSGYDGFGVGVSFEDQVYAYFSNKLNSLIIDSECSDELLEELAASTSGGQVGENLRKFIQKNLEVIREYLQKEFEGYISDVDFDMYFKRAYVQYFD